MVMNFMNWLSRKSLKRLPGVRIPHERYCLSRDADPHPLGYTYENYVVGNQIDWRKEAEKAARKKIKIDTVTITNAAWYKELSAMTNGISVPFETGNKTARWLKLLQWLVGL